LYHRGSFGGYSAVQSTTLTPDLFKCAVAVAGVYDLEMMFDEGNILRIIYGTEYLIE
jgi:dipeptidyl aminopeptidase/acylaminoacyl peptidase